MPLIYTITGNIYKDYFLLHKEKEENETKLVLEA